MTEIQVKTEAQTWREEYEFMHGVSADEWMLNDLSLASGYYENAMSGHFKSLGVTYRVDDEQVIFVFKKDGSEIAFKIEGAK